MRVWPFNRLRKRSVRIVVTLPPADWFYGLARQYAMAYTDTLRALGTEVLVLPIDAFVSGPAEVAKEGIETARRFRADLAIGLHDAGYALYCRASPRPSSAPQNVFAELLKLPTILLWDHGVLQFAPICLAELPDRPEESQSGCLSILREQLSHPRYVHVARDSGHREALHTLGIVPRDRVMVEPAPAHPSFAQMRSERSSDPLSEVAFFGNVPNPRPDRSPARHHAALVQLRETVLAAKLVKLDTPLWDQMHAELAALPRELRASLHLDADQSFYWSLLCSEIGDVCQARLRCAVLERVAQKLDFFGNAGMLAPSTSVRSRPERFAFGQELACAFKNTKITVDVVNQGFIHGFGTKVTNCFAAGGFMLLDRKRDFVDLFGAAGEAVSYSSLTELGDKIDRFAGNERARQELSESIGAQIRAQHTLPMLFGRLIERALELGRG
jgi:hypothetical protein